MSLGKISGRGVAAGLALLAIAGCGDGDAARQIANIATPAASATAAAPVAGCPAESRLPLTGACNNATPDLFLATDAALETQGPNCVWRTEELQVAADEALLFRAQDCTKDGFSRQVYSYMSGYVKSRMDGTPADQASFILQIFPLSKGETPEQAAMKTLSLAPEEQRGRCETHSLPARGEPAPKVAGKPFELGPNPAMRAELEAVAAGEIWDACGPNGVTNDAQQFWESRRTHALFHMTGQDTPNWDPASFTFYMRDARGAWIKQTD